MSYKLNDKIIGLKPYDPISGNYRMRLDANESYISLNEDIRMDIAYAINEADFNRYPDPTAAKACRKFADFYGIKAEHVTAGNGSDELISLIMTAFLKKDEGVLVFDPDFSMYKFYAGLTENPVMILKKDENLNIDVENAIREINENGIKAVFFSNPCNPTGQVLARDQVRRLINGVEALVVLDEAYMDFWDESLIKEVHEYDNVICLRTMSKAIGMAAVRMGFAVANPTLTKVLRAVKSPYNVNSLTQAAAETVLSNQGYLIDCIQLICRSRDKLYMLVKSVLDVRSDAILYPTHTNFVFFRTDAARELYDYFAAYGIAIRRLGDGIRITCSSDTDNREVARLLEQFFAQRDEAQGK
ncbi:MAG: histidinol-phosphate aminotransferase family protein [Clostridia bacterium]|nr:histidinol-phosphate aminotransferase family protein [Clostridia bacterium]